MEFHEIMPYFLVAIIVIGFIAVYDQRLLASGSVEDVSKNLTQLLLVSMINGTVTIPMPDILGSTYSYRIIVEPTLKVVGEHPSNFDIIAIVRFKEQDVRATFVDSNGKHDKFTIEPDQEIVEPKITVDLMTDIPPIMSLSAQQYSGNLHQGSQILIKDGGAMLVSVYVDRYHLFDNIADNILFECHAKFELECKDELKYTSYLKGCTPDGKPTDCEEQLDLCGGTAHVEIHGDPDCSAKTVYVSDLSYKDGKEWDDVGESAYVSFWKDTICTRRTSNAKELLALCPNDRLGGAFEMNAGILEP